MDFYKPVFHQFVISIKHTANKCWVKIANNQIRTQVTKFSKQLLCHPCHSHCRIRLDFIHNFCYRFKPFQHLSVFSIISSNLKMCTSDSHFFSASFCLFPFNTFQLDQCAHLFPNSFCLPFLPFILTFSFLLCFFDPG